MAGKCTRREEGRRNGYRKLTSKDLGMRSVLRKTTLKLLIVHSLETHILRET